uniref:Uncharacterized protein n=1 Tax=Arundo donax TaxID=35708 RepID=A0A0A9GNN9_ARUDO
MFCEVLVLSIVLIVKPWHQQFFWVSRLFLSAHRNIVSVTLPSCFMCTFITFGIKLHKLISCHQL